ncbi:cell wall hydrolase [Lachnospiraceae bacterium]|nr:cell wall hydrolase [Lachnospiraceae bacterium]
MLTIQNLFRNAYFSIKSISKKLYRSCAVLVFGFTVFAMILLKEQNIQGAGKNQVSAKNKIVEDAKEEPQKENPAELLLSEQSFAAACQSIIGEEHVRDKIQVEISRREVTAVCASVQTSCNEMQKEPLNPYGDIVVTEEDYEALCRIVQAEAGGEDEHGKVLVAEVILNRVLCDKFASTVYDVIFERSGGSPQFSPTVDGRYFSVTIMPETIAAVEQALHEEDVSNGALFFSARRKANPYDMAWFDRNLKWLFQHGGHEFYTLP